MKKSYNKQNNNVRWLMIAILTLFITIGATVMASAQVSCDELTEFVETYGDKQWTYSKGTLNCSSFLNSVEFYSYTDEETWEITYYAVCRLNWVKYIYATSHELILAWYQYADTDLCGEAWHEFIRPYKIDCW